MPKKEYKCNFEFYVLNYDPNARKVINFNIFRNYHVAHGAEDAVEKYINKELSYDELKEELLHTIQWQEWARREYEISVADAFETDCTKLEKWDCYKQAEPNIKVITDMCIDEYMRTHNV